MQIVPAFAYLMPVVILFSVGPGAAVVTTMIYAVPPADPDHGARDPRRPGNTVEAATALGATRLQLLAQGAAAAGAAACCCCGQPDDPVRALDGRDRRADRRPGARRRRHERPLHRTRRWRSSRGAAIVIMAIALDRVDRGDGRAHRPGAPAPDRGEARAGCASYTAACAGGVGARRRRSATRFGAGARLDALDGAGLAAPTTSRRALDYVQDPATFVFRTSRARSANFIVAARASSRCASFFVETPWPAMLAGLVADRAAPERPAAGARRAR